MGSVLALEPAEGDYCERLAVEVVDVNFLAKVVALILARLEREGAKERFTHTGALQSAPASLPT